MAIVCAGADAKEQLLYFRTITVTNKGARSVVLADVRIVPPRPQTFAALDDVGVTQRGGGYGEAAAAANEAAVNLSKGAQYNVTLVMDTSDGPFREYAILLG